jgi:hypothetical protein
MTREKMYITKVIVKGKGRFPLDMLRYDNCVPESSMDAAKMEDAYQNSGDAREVVLRRYSVNPGPPTIARWSSFLWTVVQVADLNGSQVNI